MRRTALLLRRERGEPSAPQSVSTRRGAPRPRDRRFSGRRDSREEGEWDRDCDSDDSPISKFSLSLARKEALSPTAATPIGLPGGKSLLGIIIIVTTRQGRTEVSEGMHPSF